jgi:hypothetical protein
MPMTRCYPIPPLTPILATVRNAISPVPELGVPATDSLMRWLTPRVERVVAPLAAGLRAPRIPVGLYTQHALATLFAELDTCSATTDDAFFVWVSSRTAAAVLDLHRTLRAARATSRKAAA